jgi:transcriptional regulator with XRE-family HTH domain
MSPVRTKNTAGRQRQTHLGKMLALYRTANGWSLREMATIIGTSHATLSRLERNYAMDADTLLRLVNWLLAAAPVAGTRETP